MLSDETVRAFRAALADDANADARPETLAWAFDDGTTSITADFPAAY